MSDLDDAEDFIHATLFKRRPRKFVCGYRNVGDLPLKAFCKNGHKFTPENTAYSKGRSARICKTCRRQRNSK